MADLENVLVWQDAPPGSDVEVGDKVTLYEMDEPYPFGHLPAHRHDSGELNDQQHRLMDDSVDEDWRRQKTLYCGKCPTWKGQGKSIVTVWVHQPSRTLWADPRGERRPTEAGGLTKSGSWLMHGATDEQPCPGSIATCPGCKSMWFVMSNRTTVFLLGLTGRFRHDSTVVE